MSLQIGELVAFITINDRGVDPALQRTQQAMRQTGRRLAQDAEDAGDQAGRQLGEGLVRGADGQWRDMQGNLVDAVTAAAADAEAEARRGGQRVGEGFGDGVNRHARQAGDGLADGVRRGGRDAEDEAGQAGDRAGGSLIGRLRGRVSAGAGEIGTNLREGIAGKLGMAALGASAGAALMSAMGEAMEQGRIVGRLGAQLGKTPAEARRYGKLAGALYADAVTEDFQGAADAISAVMRAGIAPPGATNAQLESIATKVSDLSSTFELDLGQTANAVGQMIKTGLAKDGTEAVDALTAGLQRMGPRADDIADTFNEYSTIFRQMGIDATQATGLLSQGMKAGARDTDVVADALKEFVLITQGGGKDVDAAFKKIGLSGKEMQAAFTKGGPEAKAALDKVFDGLRKIKDPAERSALAVALFGTKAEDTQKALFSLDPSSATKALGDVGGAADRMGDTLRDNAGVKVEQFKRHMQQNVVDFLGTQVIPAITGFKSMFVRQFGGIWAEAGKGGAEGADRIVAMFGLIGQRLIEKIPGLASQAVQGLSGFGQKIADYIMANPEQALKIGAIAGAILLGLSLLPVLIAVGLSAAAATIMVSFAAKLVTATTQALPGWWDSVQNWFGEKASQAGSMLAGLGIAIGLWFAGLFGRYVIGPLSQFGTSLIAYIAGLPARAVGALAGLGGALAGSARRGFDAFRNAAAQRGVQFVSWVTGLPGRIARGVGSLGGLLSPQGRQVVQGLWNGIAGMGGWLYSQVAGFVSRNVVSAAKNFLHIGSPSRLMADEVGHWIPAGVAAGIEKNAGAVDSAMAGLVTTPTPTATMAATVGAATAGGTTAGGKAAAVPTVRIQFEGHEGVKGLIRDIVRIDGGGNVQTAFGR